MKILVCVMSTTKSRSRSNVLLLIVVIVATFLLTPDEGAASIEQVIVFGPPQNEIVEENTQRPSTSGDLSFDERFNEIDKKLKQELPARIRYTIPQVMNMDETVTVELLLNPSTKPESFDAESIQIKPWMKALIILQNDEAFNIKPIDYNPNQLITNSGTTQWSWYVTAKKGGTHRLMIVVYRLLVVDGIDDWRRIRTYERDIVVNMSLMQQIRFLDWKLIGGGLITLLLTAFWRWIDSRSKNQKKLRN